jgi:L-aspartate oxidase
LHGANRLASNSLSECFVFGARAARAAAAEAETAAAIPRAASPSGSALAGATGAASAAELPAAAISAESRAALWHYAGLERSGDGLRTLRTDEHPLVRLIARSALTRQESRGAHQRSDFPQRDPALDGRHVTLGADGEPALSAWS